MATVFISYAHADAEFARYVTRCLRAAGHEPWLDEENLVAGENLEEALAEAARGADCGVFLIGWDWIKSFHARKEMKVFAHLDKAGQEMRRIGILRAPRQELEVELPSELAFFVTEEWIDGQTDAEVAAWRLHCAVTNEKPGPRETWKERGKKFIDGPPPEAPIPVTDPRSPDGTAVAGLDLPSLFCDRAEQWNRVEMVYTEPVHHLLLIAGPRCEAHDSFVTRIDQHLKKEPPHQRVRITWPLRPLTRDSFYERMAMALECRTNALARTLRERMARRNLVLIHPPVDDQFDDEDLVSYYARWLPELLAEVNPAMRLKSIQPVVWSGTEGLAKWLGMGKSEEEKAAQSFIAGVQSALKMAKPSVLTATRIDLGPIREHHVQTFCEDKRLTDRERESLLGRIRRRKRATSRDILTEIDDFLRRRAASG